MKQIILTILIFSSSAILGQTNCAIEFVAGSNKILYNENELEKLIDFSKYNAIFYGEAHIRDFEPEFKFHFIKHLNQRFQIRDVFMEIGYSAAYYYNVYLQTGDTTILTRNKFAYNPISYRSFWYNLYQYNKSQPEKLKIKIHGVDFERTEVLKLLEDFKKKDAAIPKYLHSTFNDITRLRKDTTLSAFEKTFKNGLQKIRNDFYKYENDFKTIYGNDFKMISSAIYNKAPITTKVKHRNKEWYNNMNQIIFENHINKFIGFFGKSHTRYDNPTSLTVALKNSKTFKASILHIMSIYHNFLSYRYTGNTHKIVEYEPKKQELYDKFADKNCRATLVSTEKINDPIKIKADYILFAKDIIIK